MRRLVELHKQTLASFIEQRHDMLLVVPASDADAVLLLQIASELDEASGEDLFVIVAGEHDDPDSYALASAEQVARQHALAAAAVLEAGKPPLPELPPSLLAPGRPGAERLRELVAFAHELLPREARRLVVVIAPTRIADRTAFLALVASVLPRPEREPWMSRLRLVVRDVTLEEAAEAPPHPLARVTSAGVRVAPIDFSPPAIRDSSSATASDEAAPLAERMQALLAVAILDGVHGEHVRALEALSRVLAYYQQEKNVTMQAITLNAMGEVNVLVGDNARARHWFECALPLAGESENAVILATIAKNLGSLCALEGDHQDAVQYFDGLAQIAPKMLDNETLSWALEQRGASEVALGRHDTAIETFRSGAEVSRNTDHTPGLRAHLVRLVDVYEVRGRLVDRELAVRELASLPEDAHHV